MNEKKIEMRLVAPVLLSFFVMSFVDLVGIGKDRVAGDLEKSDFILGLIPFAAFIWFFILSVPVGIIQARVGKKRMLNAGMTITGIGLFIPYFLDNFVAVIAGFALLGIGNTIVQVSANPLLVDVVPGRRASSFLSFSQFIKAIGSMLAAPLAAVFASRFGDWKLLFLVYGIISFLSVLWLGSVKIEETTATGTKASMASAFRLLGNSYILMMVLSIFLVVGIDVGFNYFSGKYLASRFGFEEVAAQSGRSVYFFGRMLGTFAGALILTKLSSTKGFLYSAILSIITILLIMIIPASNAAAWILVFLLGLGVANIFPLVFSLTVQKYPGRSNEISGLMMMAISGGALIPPVIGLVSDSLGVVPGMGVLLLCTVYLLIVSWIIIRKKLADI
ncbi:MAG: MFS transporter [Bacteroidales bacterium]|jgi:fucose permease|nr:MFS transporter [Bacteroidales bacterium]MDI9533962.1 MFS transporter [Bacteroidota bacterium]MBP7035678.1 MFS transporter [Bacteroidales bacterium]MBP8708692.1 MFS transporter [Bacteroidales bacterium]HHU98458.1 sugar MFS transporter [Bacteroidales bacterium]